MRGTGRGRLGSSTTGRNASPAFYLFFLLSLTAVFTLLPAPQTAAAEEISNACIDCHLEMEDELKAVAVDWRESVHAKAGISCHDCHGGNPADPDLSMEEDEGFKGKPAPHEIPDLCARCHSDPRRMRASNLPFDQYQKYSRSAHGTKLLKEKDAEAPNCVSCHGQHKILSVNDPESPAHRNNIVKTCGGCHSSRQIMEKRGMPFNQYELYKKSVHGAPYFETGDLGVPTCVGCHGNHGIEKTGTMSVRQVCTKCHTEQEENYKKSAHWAAARQTGKPLCIDCHSNHDVAPPTLEKFTGKGRLDCGNCHTENSIQMESALKIKKLLANASSNIEEARAALKTISEWSGSGFETTHLVRRITKAEKSMKKIVNASHSLKVIDMRIQAKKIGDLSREVKKEVDRMLADISIRKRGLIMAWAVFLVFALSIWQRTKHVKRD
jgi:hypothetical protein